MYSVQRLCGLVSVDFFLFQSFGCSKKCRGELPSRDYYWLKEEYVLYIYICIYVTDSGREEDTFFFFFLGTRWIKGTQERSGGVSYVNHTSWRNTRRYASLVKEASVVPFSSSGEAIMHSSSSRRYSLGS